MMQNFDVNGLMLFGIGCCLMGAVIMGASMRQSERHLLVG